MSEQLLRLFLTDLNIVRIKCLGIIRNQNKPCPMIYEIPVAELGQTFADNKCPVCGQSYENLAAGPDNVLDMLGKCVGWLKHMEEKKKLSLSFVLPGTEPAKK